MLVATHYKHTSTLTQQYIKGVSAHRTHLYTCIIQTYVKKKRYEYTFAHCKQDETKIYRNTLLVNGAQ